MTKKIEPVKCDKCWYKNIETHGGFCYMFKEKPDFADKCRQFKVMEVGK